jgi:hypothetical protein
MDNHGELLFEHDLIMINRGVFIVKNSCISFLPNTLRHDYDDLH